MAARDYSYRVATAPDLDPQGQLAIVSTVATGIGSPTDATGTETARNIQEQIGEARA